MIIDEYDDSQVIIMYRPKHPVDDRDAAYHVQHVVRFPFNFERTAIYDGRLWEADRWRPYNLDPFIDSLPHDWYPIPDHGPLEIPRVNVSPFKRKKAAVKVKKTESPHVENGVMSVSRVLQYYVARAKKKLLTPTDRRMIRSALSFFGVGHC